MFCWLYKESTKQRHFIKEGAVLSLQSTAHYARRPSLQHLVQAKDPLLLNWTYWHPTICDTHFSINRSHFTSMQSLLFFTRDILLTVSPLLWWCRLAHSLGLTQLCFFFVIGLYATRCWRFVHAKVKKSCDVTRDCPFTHSAWDGQGLIIFISVLLYRK